MGRECYYITVYKPLIGTVTFAPKFNTDAMLTEFTATVEDKTIPTFLDPFKDALSTLAKGAASGIKTTARTPSTEPKYRLQITKIEQKAIAVITLTKKLDGQEIGEPIRPPKIVDGVVHPGDAPQAGEKVSYTDGVEVVISTPKSDDKKAEDDKGAFKFNGSVVPPKTDK